MIINHLFQGISYLKSLQYLDIGENQVEDVPEGLLQNCPDLKLIELKMNPIRTIHPDAFINLPNLQKLIISEARTVSQFPNLNGTERLESIRFDRSQIRTIPQEICHHSPRIRSL